MISRTSVPGVDVNENGTYTLSAKLVHALIVACLTGLLSVGGYMVIWAVADVRNTARNDLRMQNIERLLEYHDAQIKNGQLPIANVRLTTIENRQKEILSAVEKLNDKIAALSKRTP